MNKYDRSNQELKYEKVKRLYGGYHRHGFIDHAYLYNLYFPPDKILFHLKEELKDLVMNYPGGQAEFAGLMGDWIHQDPKYIAVGNGAAELIKIVSGHISKRLIIPVPSFNEYVNAAPGGQTIQFPLEPPSFHLDVDKFASMAVRKKADVAVVVTPNNPTSLAIPKPDLQRLAGQLCRQGIKLIIDESFIDFADNKDQGTMEDEIRQYPNMAIFKSMSKAFGICGLRLGYMLCADPLWVEAVQKGVHIWNINGFAEEFLRILPEFRSDFIESCAKVMEDRDFLYEHLKAFPGMNVYKPDANFIFCRLPDDGPGALETTKRLFMESNILIKACDGKTMQDADRYVRIASRTKEENKYFIKALGSVLGLEALETDL